jgi:glycosyltransferase involved in cell wall biosynthesis
LSQTFIVNEILALERRGVDLVVFSLVRSREDVVQPQVEQVRAPVYYLEDRDSWRQRLTEHATVLAASPLRYARTLYFALRHRDLSAGYATSTTWGCFRSAVQVAAAVVRLRRAGSEPAHLHAHFAHDPALVAMLVQRLTDVLYSFTAHARDLVQIPAANLDARAAEATALITCCEANATYISAALPAGLAAPVKVIHHGVELHQFSPQPLRPVVLVAKLVSVGRLVEKKGFADLLKAIKGLKASGLRITCQVYGDGPLREPLTELRDFLDLSDEVNFAGEEGRGTIVKALNDADIFVLTPIVTEDGDRDGIPNVLVEAMACGLPVVTTSAGGIGELVSHGVNGLVTAPGDIADIESQISLLLDRPQLRHDLGAAARRTVEADYDVDAAAEQLEQIFLARQQIVQKAS